MQDRKLQQLLGLVRISIGMILFWAFLDKVFGLGFSTATEVAWINGTSPTKGFLTFGTSGPLAGIFQQMAGLWWVDLLFMAGLCLIGLALIIGIGVKIAGYTGALLMLLLYAAAMPPEHNPLFDDHIVYGLLLLSFTRMPIGDWIGWGQVWKQQEIVKHNPWLE